MTTTGGSCPDDQQSGLDAARQADVALLRSALSGLAGGAAPSRLTHRPAQRPECRATRAAMHDYVTGRMTPSRQRRVEVHLDRCDPCTRAFTDVRQVSWALRGLGRRLAADGHRGGRHRRSMRRTTV